MSDIEEPRFRQMYFDSNGVIKQEIVVTHRKMTSEKIEEYEKIVADSNQMTIFDFLDVVQESK